MVPPGIAYLSRLALPQILSVVSVYGALNVFNKPNPIFSTYTTWIYLVGALLAHPVYLMTRSWYTKFQDSRRAVELGAVQPPAVKDSSYKTISAIVKSFSSGYTGMSSVRALVLSYN